MPATPDKSLPHRLFLARWMLPMAPDNACLSDHGLCVNAHGRIEAVGERGKLLERFAGAEVIELGDRVLMPGLINCHTHAAMSLMRGLCNDLPLREWLEQAIWPMESRCLNAEFVSAGTELAIAEMLESGTTCLSDMYLFPEQAAAVVHRIGCRALIGLPVIDYPNPWAASVEEGLAKSLDLIEQWRGHSRIGFALSPHAPYSVSDDSFRQLLRWHERIGADMPIQIHLHESQSEIEESLRQFGARPIERLERLGLLERPTVAIHMVKADDSDIEKCQRYDVAIAHCPQSNAHFANGIAPITRMRELGIRIGLGTDGAASNNDLDLYDELSFAALLAKIESGRAEAMDAAQALRLATMGGAQALALATDIGSLEPGKCADFQAVELCGWASQPAIDIARLLVYSQRSFRVTDIWVQGVQIVRKRRLPTIDEAGLRRRIKELGASIVKTAKA